MQEVTCHEVSEPHIARALDDIRGRTRSRWHGMRYNDASPERLQEMRDELLDHVGARTVAGLALDDTSHMALRTAAECSLGVLSIGCFPDGDQEVLLPLVDESLSSEYIAFGDIIEQAPTARTWIDAFETCLVSDLMWEWRRVIGLLLRDDYAPAIRAGVPYSRLTSSSTPADLAAMDALCRYLVQADGHLPGDWPTVTLRKPDAEELAKAARHLDEVGVLTPDQCLLRVLLDDDQHAFEQALVRRLTEHRESAGSDPAPGTLLPLGALALVALAVHVHGWEPAVRSGYLPHSLLSSWAMRRATDAGVNDLGLWTAR
ncbi:immunity 49 family protein [Streptomyces niveus]|uniref:immunity 49 family protein n=1 Tax=Streptomyces niveus TaxID=193462 RepID=UPI00368D3A44